ncbi:hypothetical protein BIV57_00475 [Mangrovactinospora gilvigrisea]|uniref:Uncharacterized protein n=1 Tax=Mangrovactinospora gilvigrisea TaxID=1428644 RepID=A0A1J7CCT5_9ACTN|nr:hypothetical protein [Mangrovactinospora gilvigrisea]OIV39356.1 hypothetical protein BIV57_00475 [Mangrovactinospora gilvigrisea]
MSEHALETDVDLEEEDDEEQLDRDQIRWLRSALQSLRGDAYYQQRIEALLLTLARAFPHDPSSRIAPGAILHLASRLATYASGQAGSIDRGLPMVASGAVYYALRARLDATDAPRQLRTHLEDMSTVWEVGQRGRAPAAQRAAAALHRLRPRLADPADAHLVATMSLYAIADSPLDWHRRLATDGWRWLDARDDRSDVDRKFADEARIGLQRLLKATGTPCGPWRAAAPGTRPTQRPDREGAADEC